MPFRISKLKNVRVQFIVVMTFLVIYVLATYIIVEKYYFFKSRSNATIKPTVKLEYVVVHLDLKGAPPRLTYLESLLPLLKSHGVNGLLIEYEDMFPFEGELKNLRAMNYYKKNELQAYLTAAVMSGFEIIPLIQTFGHLEFALKHYEFMHLREVLEYPDSICPSSLDSRKFLKEMLKQFSRKGRSTTMTFNISTFLDSTCIKFNFLLAQYLKNSTVCKLNILRIQLSAAKGTKGHAFYEVIRFHQKIAPLNHIHIGCDEVFRINKCQLCRDRNLTSPELMSSHLKFITKTVHALSPLSTILIWDDMYRAVKPFDCDNLIFTGTEAVYWDYTPDVHDDVHINMYKYGRMFDNLWIATAFKGADGPTEILPNLKKRFYNHVHWLNFIFDYSTMKKLYNFKGIIVTGWSRYHHGNPLCELFPGSIPSLILNLILINKYKNGIVVQDMNHIDSYITQYIRNSFDISLRCKNNTDDFLDTFDPRTCEYDESDLYVLLQHLSNETAVLNVIIKENAFKYYLSQNDTDGFGESKVEYEYVDVIQTQKVTCGRIFRELMKIEDEIIGLLSVYYENLVIIEFVRSKIRRLEKIIDGLLDFWIFKGLIKNNTTTTSNSSIHIKNKSL